MAEKKKVRKIDLLNPKHKEFLLNYFLLGMNGRKAYLLTYPNTKPTSAEVMASRLLSNVKVKEAKKEFLKEHWDDREEIISDMFHKLKNLAGSDISDYINENGDVKVDEFKTLDTYAITQYDQTITQTETSSNIKRSIKLLDKQKAISELTKILGMVQDKTELSGTIEIVRAQRPE